ncbi:hypothetical protein [Flavobacterium rhizosphaerae]|uniref:Holin n=1 Tax=Flavobacterium rhizosphaerae TaxID=3163298 RepID=A0ABW8YZY4_9FLAO
MKTLIKKLLDFMRFTGFDFVDHAIGAAVLFTVTTLGADMLFVHEAAICIAALVTVLAAIGLEIWQGETGNGTMQVSDMCAGILSVLMCLPIALGIYEFIGKPVWENYSYWQILHVFIICCLCFYPFVWSQLPASEKKRFIGLFKK